MQRTCTSILCLTKIPISPLHINIPEGKISTKVLNCTVWLNFFFSSVHLFTASNQKQAHLWAAAVPPHIFISEVWGGATSKLPAPVRSSLCSLQLQPLPLPGATSVATKTNRRAMLHQTTKFSANHKPSLFIQFGNGYNLLMLLLAFVIQN